MADPILVRRRELGLDVRDRRRLAREINNMVWRAYGTNGNAPSSESDSNLADTERPLASPDEIEALRLYCGIPILSDLNTDHLNAAEQKLWAGMMTAAYQWRDRHLEEPGLSFVLLSEPGKSWLYSGYGCGKTHVARALMFSRSKLHWTGTVEGSVLYADRACYFRAAEIMALFDQDGFSPESIAKAGTRVVVVDDLGREGNLRWEKRTPEAQRAEKQARYFRLIDHCYWSKPRISLILTANMNRAGLTEFLGEASMSRLDEMAPAGFMWDLSGLPDVRRVRSGR
ncbi:MAG: hypothetical protein M9928_15480 [Anaerolineae bacterium]|nr:hypothetical protein [Anaerolineae bacterium]MCO5194586.1 hypothetical protein [Anaerolineae bacterium]MCO5199211.1 hypothetical protein [Anaerolineae bacterium]MCO5206437.1 hypothetical protein [Anaerolineae bacterium]